MNAKTRKQYVYSILNARSADVKHYRKVMAECGEYPYEGCGSQLTRALWLEKIGKLGAPNMTELRKYMKSRRITCQQLADECNESLAVIKKISAGRYKGAALTRVMDFIGQHPAATTTSTGSFTRQISVAPQQAHETFDNILSMIAAGKVIKINIKLEVAG